MNITISGLNSAFSIGDMIRSFDTILKNQEKRKELVSFLEKSYRGFLTERNIIFAV